MAILEKWKRQSIRGNSYSALMDSVINTSVKGTVIDLDAAGSETVHDDKR